jgi:ribosomal protein L40E
MKGPLNVIRRRRSESTAPETDAEQAATEAPNEAHPAAGFGAVTPAQAESASPSAKQPASEQPTGEGDQPIADVPAGEGEQQTAELPAGQEAIPERPSFRQRGRLRRRLRYLRRVRELGYRDLGGLVFDQHKFARMNEDLVRSKITALTAIDAELRALEHALDDRRPLTELREPGVSVCPRCGALHGSEARYCPSCGVPVHGPRAIAEVGEAVSLSVGQIGAVAAPAAPPPSAQPPSQLTLHAEPPAAEPQTQVADPATQALEPPTSVVEPEAEPQPAATEVAEREAARAEATEAAPSGEQPADEQPVGEQSPGDQPTEVMSRIDDDASDGVHGAVAQPSGERRES